MKNILLVGSLLMGTYLFADTNLNNCKGCHGANWEKRALGMSKVVADMTKKEVIQALIGYKEGTYGGAKKGIMLGQLAKYSDKELHEMAKIIKQ